MVGSLLAVLIVVLSALPAEAQPKADPSLSDGPAMVLFRTCRGAGSDPLDVVHSLLSAGWSDVTSVASLRRVATERQNMLARRKLGRASPLGQWTDATVKSAYPSTMARSLDELVALVRRNVESEIAPIPSRRQFVLAAPDAQAMAAIYYHTKSGSLTCEIVESAGVEPHLDAGDFSENLRAQEEGIRNRGSSKDDAYQVEIVKLEPQTPRDDARFPNDFDVSVWMNFLKGVDRTKP